MSMLNEFLLSFNLIIITVHIIYLFSLKNSFFIKLWLSIIFIELLFLKWPIILFSAIIIQLFFSIFILLYKPKNKYLDYDYIVVLGYVIKNDEINKTLMYRLSKALDMAKNYPKAKIILSGGKSASNTLTEAEVMKNFLLLKDIDEERIILEDKSTSTIENITNIKKVIDSQRILLISSDYHILRALWICKNKGLYPDSAKALSPYSKYLNELLLEKYCLLRMLKGD